MFGWWTRFFGGSGAFSRGMRESIDRSALQRQSRADKLRDDGEANPRTAVF